MVNVDVINDIDFGHANADMSHSLDLREKYFADFCTKLLGIVNSAGWLPIKYDRRRHNRASPRPASCFIDSGYHATILALKGEIGAAGRFWKS
jgi:hypothetical protein